MTQQQEFSGPFLQVACFCENVVQRADGVLTLVNIVDRVNITSQGTEAPDQMPVWNWQSHLVVILKAGQARGRRELRIVSERPDGSTSEPSINSVNFEGGDDRGVQVVAQMVIPLTLEGLYWFHVYLDRELLTRLPLRVTYQRITGGAMGPIPSG